MQPEGYLPIDLIKKQPGKEIAYELLPVEFSSDGRSNNQEEILEIYKNTKEHILDKKRVIRIDLNHESEGKDKHKEMPLRGYVKDLSLKPNLNKTKSLWGTLFLFNDTYEKFAKAEYPFLSVFIRNSESEPDGSQYGMVLRSVSLLSIQPAHEDLAHLNSAESKMYSREIKKSDSNKGNQKVTNMEIDKEKCDAILAAAKDCMAKNQAMMEANTSFYSTLAGAFGEGANDGEEEPPADDSEAPVEEEGMYSFFKALMGRDKGTKKKPGKKKDEKITSAGKKIEPTSDKAAALAELEDIKKQIAARKKVLMLAAETDVDSAFDDLLKKRHVKPTHKEPFKTLAAADGLETAVEIFSTMRVSGPPKGKALPNSEGGDSNKNLRYAGRKFLGFDDDHIKEAISFGSKMPNNPKDFRKILRQELAKRGKK